MNDQKTNTQQFTVEAALYVLIGAIALLLRLLNLGAAPLLTTEAQDALAVYRYTLGTSGTFSTSSPALFTFTAFLFSLFGSSEFWARFVPAIAGTAIVFIPITFRKELGRLAAIASSALLAFSSVAVASSRWADGTTLAALSLWVAVIGVRRYLNSKNKNDLVVAGIGLGLGLSSGERFFSAVVVMLFAFILAAIVKPSLFRGLLNLFEQIKVDVVILLIATGVTFFAVSSAGLLNRAGLSASAEAVPHWFSGWVPSLASRSPYLIPQLLLLYDPLIVIVCLCAFYIAFISGVWHRWITAAQSILFPPKEKDLEDGEVIGAHALRWRGLAQVLLAAAGGALFFGLVYPARQSSDALWVVLLIVPVAGKLLAELYGGEWFEDEWQTVVVQAAVLFVMMIFAFFNVSAYARSTVVLAGGQTVPYITLILAASVIALGGIITILFASGWSVVSAARGAMLAVGLVMLMGTFSSMWGVTQSRVSDPREMWVVLPTSNNIKLMTQNLRDISNRNLGYMYDIEIVVLNDLAWNDRENVLGWELRRFTNVKFVDSLPPQINSAIVIADGVIAAPILGATYSGQPFPFFGKAEGQNIFVLEEAIDWWLYRSGKVEYARKVLWVREDVQLLKKK